MELRNKHIIVLGLMRHDDGIASTNFTMARHLAKHNFVYYVDNPYTIKDCITKRKTQAFKKRRTHFSFGNSDVVATEEPNLKVIVTPPVLSLNWLPEGRLYRWLLRRNEAVIINRIMQVIRKFKIRDYIFINSFNFHYPGIASGLSAKLNIYHCVDPLIFSFDQKHGTISEAAIVKESDLVICTSSALCKEKKLLNSNTFFIPNAADIEHSSLALSEDLPEHKLLKGIKRPIVGYLGNIERRIDYPLLKKVIEMNPDKSFVFTGPVATEFIPAWLYKIPNVYLTGRVPYAEMPQVIKCFDVAVIPFKKDSVSRSIFPLKLFEYLGAGKPVVATDFNADLVEYTDDVVDYCGDAVSFSQAINSALLNDSEEAKQLRLAVAQRNTWEIRSAEFAALISKYLKQDKEVSKVWAAATA